MIAEVITRKEGRDSFKRLAAYVLNEKDGGRAHPVDWKLADYVLDRGGQGDKVASHRFTNCVSDEPGFAVCECLALAAQNTRATKDKSYHLVVSFPEGERPTDEQMVDIEETLVNAAGFEGHKRISAVHQNTDNWHMHIAIITVHPKTLRNVTPYYDRYRLQEACVALELKHGLIQTPHTTAPDLARKGRTVQGRAAGIDAHSGRASFSRWVMDNAAVPLTAAIAAAHNWAQVHAAMAEYGVEIKLRGAGLVVASLTDARSAMKASAIDRSLSFKALTDRFGTFEPAVPSGREPAKQYHGEPHGADPGLWERFQQERQQAIDVRDAARAKLRAEQLDYAERLNAWYKERYAAARVAGKRLGRADRAATRRTLEADFHADHAKRKVREREERANLAAEHVVPKWEGFLAREGSRGDQAAVKTLERRAAALISAEATRTIATTIDVSRQRPQRPGGLGRD